MKTITINRKKWVRGDIGGWSALLNSNGNRCCLGFAVCQISRLTFETIDGKCEPNDVLRKPSFLTEIDEEGILQNNKLAYMAMNINDDCGITEKVREKKLIKLFKEHGFKLVFKN